MCVLFKSTLITSFFSSTSSVWDWHSSRNENIDFVNLFLLVNFIQITCKLVFGTSSKSNQMDSAKNTYKETKRTRTNGFFFFVHSCFFSSFWCAWPTLRIHLKSHRWSPIMSTTMLAVQKYQLLKKKKKHEVGGLKKTTRSNTSTKKIVLFLSHFCLKWIFSVKSYCRSM